MTVHVFPSSIASRQSANAVGPSNSTDLEAPLKAAIAACDSAARSCRLSSASSSAQAISSELIEAIFPLDAAYRKVTAASKEAFECRDAYHGWLDRNPDPTGNDHGGADRSFWLRRRAKALRESGLTPAIDACTDAQEELKATASVFASFECRSIADVICKARFACTHDTDQALIAKQVAWDMMDLIGIRDSIAV